MLHFFFLFLSFFNYAFVVLEYKKPRGYGENKTRNQSNDPLHRQMGKIRPLDTRAYTSPL